MSTSARLKIRPHTPSEDGVVVDVTPASAGWEHVGFRVVVLEPDDTYAADGVADREACLVLVGGTADIVVGGATFSSVGGRAGPFDDAAPGAVYVPAGAAYRVHAVDRVELAICTAPGTPGRAPRRIGADQMSREVRGSGTNTRYVRNILPEDQPADSLLVVEVVTPGGHWSSYPPHKHDTVEAGVESVLEETYYHRIDPPQGFAMQRVYTDDRALDETMCVEDGDVVLVPRGYHPVGASHGYDLYYLNVMAGPERTWKFRNDPAHDWIAQRG